MYLRQKLIDAKLANYHQDIQKVIKNAVVPLKKNQPDCSSPISFERTRLIATSHIDFFLGARSQPK
jgi:hypothetical protein